MITPRIRGKMIRELADNHRWSGHFHGHTVEIERRPKLIAWRACVNRQWSEGTDPTVADALDSIERVVGK